MPLWLMMRLPLSWRRMSLRRSSIPTANMKRIRPKLLSSCTFGRLSVGKIVVKASGARRPKSEGPRRIPATISPMTAGWCSLRKIQPIIRAATRITRIWSSSSPMVDCKWCCTLAVKSSKALAPLAVASCGVLLSARPPPSRSVPQRAATEASSTMM